MISQICWQAGIDVVFVEVRVALEPMSRFLFREAETLLGQPAAGEDPVEGIDRALVLLRIGLESSGKTPNERTLRSICPVST